MALSKEKKEEVVHEIARLLDSSKMTVMASYSGTSVKSMQQLRANSLDSGTKIKVIKNRLVRKALQGSDKFKGVDTSFLKGQLLYAFNDADEVAPAQNLAAFAKNESQLTFVGAINSDGQLISPEDVKALASLPGKDQLRAQLAGTVAAPLSGFINLMSGNVRGILNALNARADQIS